MGPLKFNLLGNALDSLAQGIAFALEDDPDSSDLKLAILLTTQSVELCLKERLKREHWSLVFRNVDQAGNEDALTVTTDECLKRLDQVAKVRLEEPDKETIRRLSRIRNRIQHYEIDISFEEALSQIHAAIAFLTKFLSTELKTDINDLLSKEDIQSLIQIEAIVTELRHIASERITTLERELLPNRLADRAAWRWEIIWCPECGENYYVFSLDGQVSQCQLCKYEGGFVECMRCGYIAPRGSMEFHSEDEHFSICNNCWAGWQAE